MFEEISSEKIILEERQGEVYTSDSGMNQMKKNKHFYIESYGCQMNFSDSEIVASILQDTGYTSVESLDKADLILLNTCSIREKAEERVFIKIRSAICSLVVTP